MHRAMLDHRVEVQRTRYLEDRTLGWMSVWIGPVQVFRCATLELPWKMNANRVSCVVAGQYPLVKEWSNAFKKDLWELKLVPGRSEVKIHGANYPKQLLGCIAPGLSHSDIDGDGKIDVANSGKALARFHEALRDITQTTIIIKGDGRDVMGEKVNGYAG